MRPFQMHCAFLDLEERLGYITGTSSRCDSGGTELGQALCKCINARKQFVAMAEKDDLL